MRLESKFVHYDVVYRVTVDNPCPGATVRIYADNQWLGIGYLKKYPDCRISGPIRNAYGETMAHILKKLRKRLNKKVNSLIEKGIDI